jgi:hypothetical protein
VPDNVVLIMRFHPVHGEDFSVICEDFGAESEALEAIAHVLDAGRSLVLTRPRYDRAAHENGMVINLWGSITGSGLGGQPGWDPR